MLLLLLLLLMRLRLLSDGECVFGACISRISNQYKEDTYTDTQALFRARYGDRIVTFENVSKKSALRKTSLEHAVVDLFVCSMAAFFKGTYFSSFSEEIEALRPYSRANVFCDGAP
jgi:hypothetical protein